MCLTLLVFVADIDSPVDELIVRLSCFKFNDAVRVSLLALASKEALYD